MFSGESAVYYPEDLSLFANDSRSGDAVAAAGFADALQSHDARNEHHGLRLHG